MQVLTNTSHLVNAEVDGMNHEQATVEEEEETNCRHDNNSEESPDASDPEASASDIDTTTAACTTSSLPKSVYSSHFKNSQVHSKYLRYGIPLLLLVTTVLLLASDIGSGVVAESYLYDPSGELFDYERLVHVSIFTTVRKLWSTHSYALAIFIACTSVSWPFVKLAISLYAWMTPFTRPRRRERLLEVIDVLGKWSFVDIMVFVEIMVAFRSTVTLPYGVSLQVFIVPRWGFFGFVLSTMLSLLATQLILHYHRVVSYHNRQECHPNNETKDAQRLTSLSKTSVLFVVVALLTTSTLHLVGCFLEIYRISNQRGSIYQEHSYSLVSVGQAAPSSTTHSVYFGIRWIQIMWFFLVVAMPLWSNLMFAILYLLPMTRARRERVFLLSEIAFSWSAVEVLLVSTIFAILQIPAFGNGLLKAGCKNCYVVGSALLGNFAVLVVGTICQLVVSVWLYRRAHRTLYVPLT